MNLHSIGFVVDNFPIILFFDKFGFVWLEIKNTLKSIFYKFFFKIFSKFFAKRPTPKKTLAFFQNSVFFVLSVVKNQIVPMLYSACRKNIACGAWRNQIFHYLVCAFRCPLGDCDTYLSINFLYS